MSAGTRIEFEGHEGLKLVGDAYGDPTHAPVLLLHGGGQTRHAWGATAATLAEHGWYSIAMDARGHGDSEWCPNGDYVWINFVHDLRAIASKLTRPPVLVGASLGGITGLMAGGGPERVELEALVLVDVTPTFNPEGLARIMEFMRAKPEGFESLEEVADQIASYLPHRKRPKDVSGLEKNLRRGDNGRYFWHWDPAFMEGRDPDRVNRVNLIGVARELTMPTLLVRGRMSDIVTPETVREFLEAVPHAKFVDVADAAHMVAGDKNDVFSGAVVEFLDNEVRPGCPR